MLDGIERSSLTWRTLVEHLEAELKSLQAVLEDPEAAISERQADILRGEIKRIRAIMALADPPRERKAPSQVGPDAR